MSERIKLPVILQGQEACDRCQGVCCKGLPGESMPEQWMDRSGQIDWSLVRNAFLSGKWCIDWWEGDPRKDGYEDAGYSTAPYIRPRHENSRGIRDDALFNYGECVFLTDSGCSLEAADRNGSTYVRPTGCQLLLAKIEVVDDGIEIDCDYADGKQFKRKAAIAWLPYSNKLFETVYEAETLLALRSS
jgi:hypothetical protein